MCLWTVVGNFDADIRIVDGERGVVDHIDAIALKICGDDSLICQRETDCRERDDKGGPERVVDERQNEQMYLTGDGAQQLNSFLLEDRRNLDFLAFGLHREVTVVQRHSELCSCTSLLFASFGLGGRYTSGQRRRSTKDATATPLFTHN